MTYCLDWGFHFKKHSASDFHFPNESLGVLHFDIEILCWKGGGLLFKVGTPTQYFCKVENSCRYLFMLFSFIKTQAAAPSASFAELAGVIVSPQRVGNRSRLSRL